MSDHRRIKIAAALAATPGTATTAPGVAVGQVRRWETLPSGPRGAKHTANGRLFRVEKISDDGRLQGKYMTGRIDICYSTVDHTREHSVLIDARAPATPGGKGTP